MDWAATLGAVCGMSFLPFKELGLVAVTSTFHMERLIVSCAGSGPCHECLTPASHCPKCVLHLCKDSKAVGPERTWGCALGEVLAGGPVGAQTGMYSLEPVHPAARQQGLLQAHSSADALLCREQAWLM